MCPPIKAPPPSFSVEPSNEKEGGARLAAPLLTRRLHANGALYQLNMSPINRTEQSQQSRYSMLKIEDRIAEFQPGEGMDKYPSPTISGEHCVAPHPPVTRWKGVVQAGTFKSGGAPSST